MGDACREIAKHFAHVSALLISTWGLKKLLSWTSSDGPKSPEEPERLSRTKSHKLIPHPESQFEVATPDWLSQYEELDDKEDIPQPEPVIRALEQLEEQKEHLRLGQDRLREDLFMLKTDVAQHYLNAGSYGGACKLSVDAQIWYQKLLEAEPCYFNTEVAPKALQIAKRRLAEFVGAKEGDIVHMTNATAAVNTVLLSTPLRKSDLLLITSITYPAVRNAASRFSARAGAGIVEVLLDLQTLLNGAEAIIARFRSTLAQYGSRIRLAILDHITSSPTVHLPVTAIASLCQRHGIKVLVDGAHAVGAIPLDVPNLGVHFYTSNLHKWGCCPKSAAFLWVHPQLQGDMVPLVTSHGYKTGFQGEFAWQGTSDISAWLAVPTALRLKHILGVQRLQDHNHQKLDKAVEMLLHAWGNDLKVLGSNASCSHMASIELPKMEGYPCRSETASQLHAHLLKERKIEVPINFWEGRLWVRISSQIYNTYEDYEALKRAICDLAC